MTASYPNSARSFRNPTSSTTAVQSDGTDLHAADHTAVEEEVAAISSDLRTAKGASGNMAAKITAMDASIASAYVAGGTDVAIADGGTGASTASGARTNLGLGGAAVLNVGTTAGTVAAGDDARFGAASLQNTRPYVLVAASDATTAVKNAADYVCTGTSVSSTDHTTIQTAIDYAATNGINHIKLSSGTFYISTLNSLNLGGNAAGTTFYSNMKLEGSGSPHSFLTAQAGGGTRLVYMGSDPGTTKGSILKVQPAATNPNGSRKSRFVISGIAVDGKGLGNGGIGGIMLQWVNVWTLSDIEITGCRGHGLYLNGAADGTLQRIRFQSCGTTNYSTTTAYPQDSASAAAALMMSSDNNTTAGYGVDNVVVRDCWWENGMARMVWITANDPNINYTGAQRLRPNIITFDRCKFEAQALSGGTYNALFCADAVIDLTIKDCFFFINRAATQADTATEVAAQQPDACIRIRSSYNVNILDNLFVTGNGGTIPGTNKGILIDRANGLVNSSAQTSPGSAITEYPAVFDGVNISNNNFDPGGVAGKKWAAKSIYYNTGGSTITNVVRENNYERNTDTTYVIETLKQVASVGSLVGRTTASPTATNS
jgi:hypothetical protein